MQKSFKLQIVNGRSRRLNGRWASRREKNFSLVMLSGFVLTGSMFMQMGDQAKLHDMLYPQPLFKQPDFVVRADDGKIEPSSSSVPHKFSYEEAFNYVWMRESSQGKNNPAGSAAQKCYAKGKVNEIGMGGVAHTVCYENFAEMKAGFNKWLDKNHKGNWTETLCYYNVGLRNNCEYGTKFTEGK